MPLTYEQKQRILAPYGYSPEDVDIDESTGAVYGRVKEQPTASANTIPTVENKGPSVLETTVRGAAQSIGPLAAGIKAAGLSELIPGVTSNPYTAIGVPLVAGGVVSALAALGQEKLLPDSIKQKLFLRPEDRATNPIAAKVGEYVPLAASFNPITGIRNIPKVLSGARKLATGAIAREGGAILPEVSQAEFEALPSFSKRALSPNEVNALKNAAIGVGGNVGLNTAQQLISNEPYSPLSSLESAASGLIFNEPTRLGSKLFRLRPTEVVKPNVTKKSSIIPNQESLGIKDVSAADVYVGERAALPREDTKADFLSRELELRKQIALDEKNKSLLEAEGGIPQDELPINKKEREFELASREKNAQDLEEQRKAKAELDRQEAAQLASENAARALDLQQSLTKNIISKPEIKPQPKAVTELGKEIHPDYTGNIEYDVNVNKNTPPTQADEVLKKLNKEKYSEESKLTPDQKEQTYQATLAKSKELARQRGFNLREEPIAGVTTSEGKQANAKIVGRDITTGQIGSRAGDAIPHESVGHGLVSDYLHSTRKADNELVLNALRKIPNGEDAVFRYRQKEKFAKNAEEKAALKEELLNSDVAEKLAELVGTRGYERLKNSKGEFREDSLGKFFKDLTSKIKVKTGSGNAESHADYLLARSEFDAPYGSRKELLNKDKIAEAPSNVRFSSKPEDSKEFSKEDYSSMAPDDFIDKVSEKRPLTIEATRLGEEAKTSKEEVQKLSELSKKHTELSKEQLASDNLNEGAANAYKAQLFREAHEYATESGSIGMGLKKGTIKHYDINEVKGKFSEESNLRDEDSKKESISWEKNAFYKWTPISDFNKKVFGTIEGYLYNDPVKSGVLGLINKNGKVHHVFVKDGTVEKLSSPTEEGKIVHDKAIEEGYRILSSGEFTKAFEDMKKAFNDFFNSDPNWKGSNPNDTYEGYEKAKLTSKSSAEATKEAIKNARKNGASPEFKSLFGGIDPELVGTTHDKVKEFANSLGITYHPIKATKYSSESKLTPEQIKKGIEDDLGEASFKAAKNVKFGSFLHNSPENSFESAQELREFLNKNPNYEDTSYYFDNELQHSAGRSRESIASDKANELEAFTRPDVERHSKETALTKEDIDEPNLGPKVLRVIEADLDSQRRKGPDFIKAADALDEFLNNSRSELAKYEPDIVKASKEVSTKDKNDLLAKLYEERDTNVSQRDSLTPEQQTLYDALKAKYKEAHDDQRAANQPIQQADGKYRLPEDSPFYVNHKIADDVIDTLNNEPDSEKFNKLQEDYISWETSHGVPKATAEQDFKDTLQQYGGTSLKTRFGATRLEQSIGLPPSWREANFDKAVHNYFTRFSKDRAWHDTIEKDSYLNQLFGNVKDAWGESYKETDPTPKRNLLSNQDFRKTVQLATGWQDYTRQNKLDAVAGITSAAMLGTTTGIGDVVSQETGMWKYVKSSQVPLLLKSWTNITDSWKHAVSTGLIRNDVTKIYDVLESTGKFEDVARKIQSTLYKVSGRSWLEKFSRALGQGKGEIIAQLKIDEAKAGNVDSEKFLKQLVNGRDYEDYSLEELGTRISQKQQGTYDVRQLPKVAIDSNISPFLRLSRWNIGQTGEFFKNVVNPAKEGNFSPLLNTLFGSIAGGLLIKELRELISDKKDIVPSFKEIDASSNPDPYNKAGLKFYNLSAAAAYAGFGGLIGDLVKATLDIAHNNQPQGFSYPTIDVLADLGAKIPQMAKAIAEGENIGDVSVKFTEDLLKQHFQVLRLAMNQAKRIAPESDLAKEQESNANRATLRRFKQVEGEDVTPLSKSLFENNPYEDLGVKNFKRTGNVQEAAEELPILIDKAIGKSGNDPYKLANELDKLRRNSYQTIPNPTRNPVEFAKYILFIQKTKSPEEVNKIVQDYFEQNAKNKIKSQLVPQIKLK